MKLPWLSIWSNATFSSSWWHGKEEKKRQTRSKENDYACSKVEKITQHVNLFVPPECLMCKKKFLQVLKGAVSRYSVIFCAFFARAKNGGCSRKCRGHQTWKLDRPRGLAAWPPALGYWHDSAVNQRQVELELHCFTCRRRQAALLFSGYEARARWYPLLQGSRLAATAISISILYSRVWFCAPSEACFGDLVAESMGDWDKESAVWS